MRRAITVVFRTGASQPEVITGPGVPLTKQLKAFKANGLPSGCDEIQVWSSTAGIIKRKRKNSGGVDLGALVPVREQRSKRKAEEAEEAAKKSSESSQTETEAPDQSKPADKSGKNK